MKKTIFIASCVSIISLLFFCLVYDVGTSNAVLDKYSGQHTSTVMEEDGVKVKVLYGDQIARFFNRKDIRVIKVDVFASYRGFVANVVVFYKMK